MMRFEKLEQSLFQIIFEKEKNENFMISPLSLVFALAMVMNGAEGKTKKELLKVLSDKKKSDDINKELQELGKKLTKNETMLVSNCLCVRPDVEGNLKEEYRLCLKEMYDAEIFVSENMAHDVNEWVSQKTKGMIPNIMDSDSNVLMTLINALVFEASWMDPFEIGDTYLVDFTNSDGSKSTVQMMHSNERSYYENRFFRGIVKHYQTESYDSNFALVALLPKKAGQEFFEKAVQHLDMESVLNKAKMVSVEVGLPSFELDYGTSLKAAINALGVKTALTPAADFSGITEEVPLIISDVIQKTHIKVDEQGTKAAAATMSLIVTGCCPPKRIEKLIFDRPFCYGIVNVETGIPVFMGAINRL